MTIRLILTGGTIDKSYRETTGELVFGQTYLPELISRGRSRAGLKIRELMLKDSLDMNDADRGKILDACLNSKESQILITHGTDTMVDTAAVLARSKPDKTIVLTGAMIPAVFTHSDALFNVGFALAAVQTLPAGVYIAMNGLIFDWDKVKKDTTAGVFVAI